MTTLFDAQLERGLEAIADTILIVENDDAIREMLTLCIETETPYHPMPLADSKAVLQHLDTLKEANIALFIFDYSLSVMNAIDLYDHLCTLVEFENAPAIILTALRLDYTAESAIIRRGLKLLLKPFDIDDLLRHIEQALMRPTQLI